MKIKLGFFIIFFTFSIFQTKETPFYLGISLEGDHILKKQLVSIEDEIGFKPSFINLFLQFPENPSSKNFPLDALEEIWSFGSVPIITLEPFILIHSKKQIITIDMLPKYDQYLSYLSYVIKNFNRPIIIRLAHEMNISKYHWGVNKLDERSATIYKDLYRYIVLFFKQEKVNNILWAFCPNADSVPNLAWNNIENYYPGDDVVDILGLDGYDFGSELIDGWQSYPRSFEQIFSSSLKILKKLNSRLPIFIFETATNDENRKKWILDSLSYAKREKIDALIWFQIDKEQKWKLTSKDAAIFKELKQKDPQKWIYKNEKK